MVLLASWKVNDLQLRADGDSRERAWSRCLAIFEHYENQIHSAEHAMKILKSLKAQIFQSSNTQSSTGSVLAPKFSVVRGLMMCSDESDTRLACAA